MVAVIGMVLILAAHGPGQQASMTGTWRTVDPAMGTPRDAVPSPLALAERRTRQTVTALELIITQATDTVDVARPDKGEAWSLPLTGTRVQRLDRKGAVVIVGATKEGDALVLRTERTVRLPGGPEILVETTERHVLQADGSLRVTIVARSGAEMHTRTLTYQRVR